MKYVYVILCVLMYSLYNIYYIYILYIHAVTCLLCKSLHILLAKAHHAFRFAYFHPHNPGHLSVSLCTGPIRAKKLGGYYFKAQVL
jgi:hypothetical protein